MNKDNKAFNKSEYMSLYNLTKRVRKVWPNYMDLTKHPEMAPRAGYILEAFLKAAGSDRLTFDILHSPLADKWRKQAIKAWESHVRATAGPTAAKAEPRLSAKRIAEAKKIAKPRSLGYRLISGVIEANDAKIADLREKATYIRESSLLSMLSKNAADGLAKDYEEIITAVQMINKELKADLEKLS